MQATLTLVAAILLVAIITMTSVTAFGAARVVGRKAGNHEGCRDDEHSERSHEHFILLLIVAHGITWNGTLLVSVPLGVVVTPNSLTA